MALTHGEAQSRAHAELAKATADAKEYLARLLRKFDDDPAQWRYDGIENATAAVKAAKAAERKAFLAYTDPFGVKK